MIDHRNRATGWKHAKLSGHENEKQVGELLNESKDFQKEFLSMIDLDNETIINAEIGGLHEKNVPSVLGKTTKSKTDLKVLCQSGKQINISIKKSLSGQVYFVRVDNFFDIFEKQFNKNIPDGVKRAMRLFWAASDDAIDIIKQYSNKEPAKDYGQQIKHHSLNASTLLNYDKNLHKEMLQWFKDNIYEITKLCFTIGAVKDECEWSDYVWYINTLGENTTNKIFHINEICETSKLVANTNVYYGNTNGGTTIQLPFGFVQWHQEQMQFHHSFEKISSLMEI